MSVLLYREALKAGLPDMAGATMAVAVLLNMTGKPPMHESAEDAHARGFEDDVKMIGEQAEAKQLHLMTGFRSCQQIKEAGVIVFIMEDGRTVIAPINDVIHIAVDLSAWEPWHLEQVRHDKPRMVESNRSVPLIFPGRTESAWSGRRARMPR